MLLTALSKLTLSPAWLGRELKPDHVPAVNLTVPCLLTRGQPVSLSSISPQTILAWTLETYLKTWQMYPSGTNMEETWSFLTKPDIWAWASMNGWFLRYSQRTQLSSKRYALLDNREERATLQTVTRAYLHEIESICSRRWEKDDRYKKTHFVYCRFNNDNCIKVDKILGRRWEQKQFLYI
jgi:hypothetical protein